MSLRRLTLAAALLVAPALAGAQTATPAAATPHTQVLSINPITAVFGLFSADYERKVGTATSVGVGGSYYSSSGFTYLSVEAKPRYYASGTALRGFSVAGIAGVTRVSGSDDDCIGSCTDESATAAALGVNLDYQWLLGQQQKFAVALGLGAKRLFGVDDISGVSATLPTARVAIGIAF